jgi:hypothetical protein
MVQHGPKEFAPINMPRNCNAGILPAKLKRRPRSAGILPAFFGARGSGRTSAVSAGALRASASVVLPKGGPSRAASCTLEACATRIGSVRSRVTVLSVKFECRFLRAGILPSGSEHSPVAQASCLHSSAPVVLTGRLPSLSALCAHRRPWFCRKVGRLVRRRARWKRALQGAGAHADIAGSLYQERRRRALCRVICYATDRPQFMLTILALRRCCEANLRVFCTNPRTRDSESCIRNAGKTHPRRG